MNFLLPRCERCKGRLGPNHNEQECVRRATAGVNRRYFFGALLSAVVTLAVPEISFHKGDRVDVDLVGRWDLLENRVHLIDLYGFNIPEGFASPQLRVSDGKLYRFYRENPYSTIWPVIVDSTQRANEISFESRRGIEARVFNIGTKECL